MNVYFNHSFAWLFWPSKHQVILTIVWVTWVAVVLTHFLGSFDPLVFAVQDRSKWQRALVQFWWSSSMTSRAEKMSQALMYITERVCRLFVLSHQCSRLPLRLKEGGSHIKGPCIYLCNSEAVILRVAQLLWEIIPNHASVVHQLNAILWDGNQWRWSKQCADASSLPRRSSWRRQCLVSMTRSYVYLSNWLEMLPNTGWEQCRLSHVLPDSSEKPVAYVSWALLPNKQQYAQQRKEALLLVYGIQKFHQYIGWNPS